MVLVCGSYLRLCFAPIFRLLLSVSNLTVVCVCFCLLKKKKVHSIFNTVYQNQIICFHFHSVTVKRRWRRNTKIKSQHNTFLKHKAINASTVPHIGSCHLLLQIQNLICAVCSELSRIKAYFNYTFLAYCIHA